LRWGIQTHGSGIGIYTDRVTAADTHEECEREEAKRNTVEKDSTPISILRVFMDILKFLVLLAILCADNSKRRNFTGMNRMNRISR
jgi:hypothetical protein